LHFYYFITTFRQAVDVVVVEDEDRVNLRTRSGLQ
jgi:hypothetical protein